MALNYGIQFVVYAEDGITPISDAKVHCYFNKVSSSSSTSKWDGTIRRTNAAGQTSVNLGDLSFLTTDGKIDNGDTVLVAVWLADNNTVSINDKSSTVAGKILRCVNFIHTVNTSSSSWVERLVLPVVATPVCNINFPTVTHTGHQFTIGNTSTTVHGPYSYNIGNVNRSDLYQSLSMYSQALFTGMNIKETFYNLIEYSETKSGISTLTYKYIDSGIYNTYVRVYNHLGYYCEKTYTYTIMYNKPTIAFDFTFTKLLNTSKYIGVGNDDQLKVTQQSSTNYGDTWAQIQATFDWKITDLTVSGSDNTSTWISQNELFNPTKYFLSEGTKSITLDIHWNDGFNWFKETLVKNPFLDIYNIKQDFNWITQKLYKPGSVYVPLGDDDLVTVSNLNYDNATQDYYSNTQWKSIKWNITKKKNDGSYDNEEFLYIKDTDNYLTKPTFYIKFYHTSSDLASIKETLVYWDGYKDVTKELTKNLETQKYLINHSFIWNTDLYGLNKVVTRDDDGVTITNTSTFSPQNNTSIVQRVEYWVTKDKYTSYSDSSILQDNEYFDYTSLTEEPYFYIRKEGDWDILNRISYYDGYDNVTSDLSKTIQARVQVPNIRFDWYTRNGKNVYVEGRDDLTRFRNESTLTDFYGTEYSRTNSRHIKIDWTMYNYKTLGNYNNPSIIGGSTFTESTNYYDQFLNSTIIFEPEINYWSAKTSQDVIMKFYYNDGFFNRDISLTKQIETRPYVDLIPGATYTQVVPDRHTIVQFKDNSTSNQIRIISEDWSLTDRYSITSMNFEKRGSDNLQEWFDIPRLNTIETKINSFENHTLSQTEIRWDDGFKLKLFSNSYNISTTKYSINPDFTYEQIFVTGPEIRFFNTCTVNDNAVQLRYDLEIEDTYNDGSDAFASYEGINILDTVEHTYKSVSNSPHLPDVANKEVTIFNWFDDGWDEDYRTRTKLINVKPNRISQDFLTIPVRHPADLITDTKKITGNNPIKFKDNSGTLRIDSFGNTDYTFIKNVTYDISDI